jgi:hypothetical protein
MGKESLGDGMTELSADDAVDGWKPYRFSDQPMEKIVFYPYFSNQPALVWDESGIHEEFLPQAEITIGELKTL